MKKLSLERMEKIEGGDECLAWMWCIFSGPDIYYKLCMEKFLERC